MPRLPKLPLYRNYLCNKCSVYVSGFGFTIGLWAVGLLGLTFSDGNRKVELSTQVNLNSLLSKKLSPNFVFSPGNLDLTN